MRLTLVHKDKFDHFWLLNRCKLFLKAKNFNFFSLM